jgi:hypothetical protein
VEVAVYPPMPGDVTPSSEEVGKETVTFEGPDMKEDV